MPLGRFRSRRRSHPAIPPFCPTPPHNPPPPLPHPTPQSTPPLSHPTPPHPLRPLYHHSSLCVVCGMVIRCAFPGNASGAMPCCRWTSPRPRVTCCTFSPMERCMDAWMQRKGLVCAIVLGVALRLLLETQALCCKTLPSCSAWSRLNRQPCPAATDWRPPSSATFDYCTSANSAHYLDPVICVVISLCSRWGWLEGSLPVRKPVSAHHGFGPTGPGAASCAPEPHRAANSLDLLSWMPS